MALRGGVAEVKLAEMQVNSVNLRFKDPKTGEAREEGSTRPDIIMRHLCTKPGQVMNRMSVVPACYKVRWLPSTGRVRKLADPGVHPARHHHAPPVHQALGR